MSLTEILGAGALLIGLAFTLLGSIGLVRMPDTYNRMHATTKATTLGVSGLVVAAALSSGSPEGAAKALLIALFLFLTAPVGAHMIARAIWAQRQPLWPGTKFNELLAAEEERVAAEEEKEAEGAESSTA